MDLSRLRYDERGLIPAIVQQHDTDEVLMMAWMSPATLRETIASGETVFWSRSRDQRWHKGATSGNVQKVVSVTADCDADTLLIRVDQQGSGACHTGARSCFHHDVEGEGERQRAGGRGSEGEGERQRAGGRGSEGEGERQRAGGRGA